MKRKHLLVIGAILAVVIAAAMLGLLLKQRENEALLDANGQVRGTEVTISAKVGGTADVVSLREGQGVRKGEPIVQISSREIEARLVQARAQASAAANLIVEIDARLGVLDTAREQARLGAGVALNTSTHEIHRASKALDRAAAEVVATEAQYVQERAAYERFERLLGQGFVSRNYFDEVSARYRTSEARLKAARQAQEEARAAVEKAQAASGEVAVKEKDIQRLAGERERLKAERTTAGSQAEAARARVAEIESQLADTRVFAPTDGTVISKLVEPGELVAPGRPLAILVDLADLYVRVYVAERHIGKIRLGNPARISVDAFPGRFFPGEVIEIAQQAEFTPKEVHMKDEREKLVFGVKVRIANPDGLLKPGMPADVSIKVDPDAQW